MALTTHHSAATYFHANDVMFKTVNIACEIIINDSKLAKQRTISWLAITVNLAMLQTR